MSDPTCKQVWTGADNNIRGAECLVGPAPVRLVVQPLPGRRTVLVQNQGPSDLYLGVKSVRVGAGVLLSSSASMSFDLGEHIDLWAVCSVQQLSGAATWCLEAA